MAMYNRNVLTVYINVNVAVALQQKHLWGEIGHTSIPQHWYHSNTASMPDKPRKCFIPIADDGRGKVYSDSARTLQMSVCLENKCYGWRLDLH